jgi:aldehyde dehydrogenase (NAD+)
MMPTILSNNGQMCIQPARLVIPEHRKDEIVAAFTEVVVGPPDAPGTDLGPLISRKQYDYAMGLLKSAAEDGGRFVTGGGHSPRLDTGFYVAPTIITDVSPVPGGAGGDLRAGDGRVHLHQRGGGAAVRQRHRIRAQRRCLQR